MNTLIKFATLTPRQFRVRKRRTAIVSLFLMLFLLSIIALGAFSMDLAHGAMVKQQFQTAVDAGALAGAQELARSNLDSDDISRAQDYATTITSANLADNMPVSNTSPATSVSVELAPAASPRTVTVTAARTMQTIFARMIGWNTFPVSATATAGAFNNIKIVRPDQVVALAVSLDSIPEKGPQQGIPLSSIIGPGAENREFTIVLSPTKSENGAWIKNWSAYNDDPITVGVDTIGLTNGVVDSLTKTLQPDQTIVVPIFKGNPPFNDSRTIVAVIGMRIIRVNFPKEITVRLCDQVLLSGISGQRSTSQLTPLEGTFVNQWSPWQVRLLN